MRCLPSAAAHAHADAYADANRHADSHADGHTDAYADADHCTDPDAHHHPDADSERYADSYGDQNGYAYHNAHTYLYAEHARGLSAHCRSPEVMEIPPRRDGALLIRASLWRACVSRGTRSGLSKHRPLQ